MPDDTFDDGKPFRLALKPAEPDDAGDDEAPESQQDRYENRFPQEVGVADIVGKLLIEGNNTTIGRIKGVARTGDGKVLLIVPYRTFLGLGGRLVAVPLEVVASIGTALVSVDMERAVYDSAPVWQQGDAVLLGPTDPVRVAITRH